MLQMLCVCEGTTGPLLADTNHPKSGWLQKAIVRSSQFCGSAGQVPPLCSPQPTPKAASGWGSAGRGGPRWPHGLAEACLSARGLSPPGALLSISVAPTCPRGQQPQTLRVSLLSHPTAQCQGQPRPERLGRNRTSHRRLAALQRGVLADMGGVCRSFPPRGDSAQDKPFQDSLCIHSK